MDLLELEQGVDPAAHWYYRTKADSLERFVLRSAAGVRAVTDVGAGSGFFSEVVLQALPQATATCVDPNYTDEQLAAGTDRLRFRRACTDPADLYLFMDVLEHVADDVALLREYVDTAPSGARFFVTVPAMQYLWSGHDVFLGHHRRYTLRQIERVVDDAGLVRDGGRYLYGATFPLVAGVRLAQRARQREATSDMKPAAPWVNSLLTRTLRAENRLPGNRVAGSTAVVTARKP